MKGSYTRNVRLCVLVIAVVALASIGITGCAPRPSAGTETSAVKGTFAELSDEQLADKADMIVIGTVASTPTAVKGRPMTDTVRSRLKKKGLSDDEIDQMDADEVAAVYAMVKVRPDEVLKGPERTDTVDVRVLGGEADGTEVVAEDFPEFETGERVLLFLGKEFDDSLGPLAVYRLDGENAVSRDLGIERTLKLQDLRDAIAAAEKK